MTGVSNHTQAALVENSYFVFTKIFTAQNEEDPNPVYQLRRVGNNHFTLLMLRSSKILQFTQSLLSCFNEQFGTQCKMIELVLYFQTFEFEYRINRHEYVVALGSNPTGWGFG